MSEAYAIWPFDCPTSWQEAAHPAIIRSEVQDGYPKVRRSFTRDWATFDVAWVIDKGDVAAFRSFVDFECQGGAQPFRVEDPFTGALRLVRWTEPPRLASSAGAMPVVTITGRLEEMFS